MAAASLTLGARTVLTYYADISALDVGGRTERALAWLDAGEQARHQRFRGEDDRRMFLLGRVMARALVGRALDLPPTAWRWTEGTHGRPEIAFPATPVRFNIAHSARLVVCALSAAREVGVDVEDLGRRAIEPGLVSRYFSPGEVADINVDLAGWERRFLCYWTLKEAYLKACGLGISVHLADVGFSLDGPEPRVSFFRSMAGSQPKWRFQLAQPTNRHLIAIAASAADGLLPEIDLRRFDVGLELGS
jgi:4'-phosphopantetheinyl transferase